MGMREVSELVGGLVGEWVGTWMDVDGFTLTLIAHTHRNYPQLLAYL